MKEIEVDEKLATAIQRDPRNADNIMVTADSAQIRLGIERNPRGAITSLKIFTQKKDRATVIDELHLSIDRRPGFWWSQYARSHDQTRGEVKSRLESLGFDPTILDQLFPDYTAHKKIVEASKMTCSTNCGECGGVFDLISQSATCPHYLLWGK